jgi:hypothetical protein
MGSREAIHFGSPWRRLGRIRLRPANPPLTIPAGGAGGASFAHLAPPPLDPLTVDLLELRPAASPLSGAGRDKVRR